MAQAPTAAGAARAGGEDMPASVTAPLAQVEQHLARSVERLALPPNLHEATEYALLGGGKRLRPLLAVHACAALGGATRQALPAAAAVEMIHAFSLVHDDLPALDNDDLRRGRPTLHRAHGEAMAILVGDGLMSAAFQIITDECPPALAGLLCAELARGSTRMIAGQVLDTLGGFPPELDDRTRLDQIHHNKTGALIVASCRMGALSALRGYPDNLRESARLDAVTDYARAIGLMFQIVDDLLDVLQSPDHTGKKTGKDMEAGKLTFPGLLGVEGSRREVERLLAEAHRAVRPFGSAAESLTVIADYLAVRTR